MSKSYNNFPKGSEWRKWDLHVHTPDTKLNFQGFEIDEKWEKYCQTLEESDVAVFGITDYFSIDNYFKLVEQFQDKYPLTNKTFFPNIEFRTESKNSNNEHIQVHVLFSNSKSTTDKISEFLTRLKLVSTDNETMQKKFCTTKDLDEIGYDKAMVHMKELVESLSDGFAKNEYLIVGVANGYGSLRPNGKNDGKGGEYAKELDKKYQAFFGTSRNRDFYLNKIQGREEFSLPAKPVVTGSDAHSFNDLNNKLGKTFEKKDADGKVTDYSEITWIKADPTFEGLRQIIFEPEHRVSIQAGKPEEKSGYQVIDRIEISSDRIQNRKIDLNQNLNSIIGGRSSGKSVLLAAIAKKVNPTRKINLIDHDYEKFVEDISKSIKVYWKDNKEEDSREIEYFEQGYMHGIARNSSELDRIVKGILLQKGKEAILESHSQFNSSNAKEISNLISDYFRVSQDVEEKLIKLRDKGDAEGISQEIAKLTNELESLSKTTITPEEQEGYETIKKQISDYTQACKVAESDALNIDRISSIPLFKNDIDYQIANLSGDLSQSLNSLIEELKSDFNSKWNKGLNELKAKSEGVKITALDEVKKLEGQEGFIKVRDYYSQNTQLLELEKRIKNEREKLLEIDKIKTEKVNLENQLATIKDEVFKLIKEYYSKIEKLPTLLNLENNELRIKTKIKFKELEFCEIIKAGLNQQSTESQNLATFKYSNFEQFELRQRELFSQLTQNKLTLKGGYTNQTLLSALLSTNYYELSFDIEYDNDSFKTMSDGKKAFVVLQLLLDFSEKDCPILIDQPEDDLDNRAIYIDLVKYLTNKKKHRQIILATHNPNIVVGGDSELVICANQDGVKNKNRDGFKFQYLTGSLEYSSTKKENKEFILECQGTREHVCEILEGGNYAFKLREKKYGIT